MCKSIILTKTASSHIFQIFNINSDNYPKMDGQESLRIQKHIFDFYKFNNFSPNQCWCVGLNTGAGDVW